MSKIFNLSVFAIIFSFLPGFGPADMPQSPEEMNQAGEVPAVEAGNSEGAPLLGTATHELNSTGEFSWRQGWQATPMGSASDRVCFLTRMTGLFMGGAEVIHAFVAGGSWYLGGSSNQIDVAASARCAYVPSSSYYTGEYSWSQGQYPTYLGPSANRVCFLTRVTGRFEGWGEWVHVYESGGSWFLWGASQQVDVAARARCVSVSSYSGEYSWNQYQGYPSYMGPTSGSSCALTYVKGKFKGGGESVHIFESAGSWYLGGGSLQQDVEARARCF